MVRLSRGVPMAERGTQIGMALVSSGSQQQAAEILWQQLKLGPSRAEGVTERCERPALLQADALRHHGLHAAQAARQHIETKCTEAYRNWMITTVDSSLQR